jgi:hypothetical protein
VVVVFSVVVRSTWCAALRRPWLVPARLVPARLVPARRRRAALTKPAVIITAPYVRSTPATAGMSQLRDPLTTWLTMPISGTEYQTTPRICTAVTGAGSASALLSPLSTKVRSPFDDDDTETTRWLTTAGWPDTIW